MGLTARGDHGPHACISALPLSSYSDASPTRAADITTLLLDPAAFTHVIDLLAERYQGQSVEAVAGALRAAGPQVELWTTQGLAAPEQVSHAQQYCATMRSRGYLPKISCAASVVGPSAARSPLAMRANVPSDTHHRSRWAGMPAVHRLRGAGLHLRAAPGPAAEGAVHPVEEAGQASGCAPARPVAE